MSLPDISSTNHRNGSKSLKNKVFESRLLSLIHAPIHKLIKKGFEASWSIVSKASIMSNGTESLFWLNHSKRLALILFCSSGRVFVHCLMGVSRSATLVLAFLMICEDLTLMEAVKSVRQHRDICPNPGFLNQLRHLDMSLVRERKKKLEAYKL